MTRSFARACGRSSDLMPRSRITARVIAVLLVGWGLALANGAQAHAAPKGLHEFIGSSGTEAGQFNAPRGVAVRHSTGHIYVVDGANHRIQQFGPDGTFMRAWGWDVDATLMSGTEFEVCELLEPCKQGVPGGGAGQLNGPQGIAVDQRTGHVYVTNQSNGRIDKFDAEGNFLFAFGWNVDPDVEPDPPGIGLETCTTVTGCQIGTPGAGLGQFGPTMGYPAVDPANGEVIDGTLNGDVVVADPANRRVQKFTSSGGFRAAFGGASVFASGQPTRVAADSSGSIYTVEGGTGRRVQKFNPSGSSRVVFAPEHVSGTSSTTAPTDVAIEPATDNVLVTKPEGTASATTRRVVELNPVGALVDDHAVGAGLPATTGLAVAGSSGKLYLPTSQHRIWVFGPITPPSVVMHPVEDITAVSATFKGTVNPNGTVASTRYRFEYSGDGGATWERVPASDVDIGNDNADEDVTQAVEDLEPNTAYLARLVATRDNAAGSATSAPPRSFTTPAAPPGISEVGAREVTDTTALLAGNVDPNRLHSTYRFEYGPDTSYGTTTVVDNAGSGATRVPVSKAVTGLQPNTTYHFRLVASNAAGEAQGADRTFTTGANPPQPSGRAYEMVSPVDKNGGHVERDFVQSVTFNSQSGAAASGDAAAFTSRLQFADIESGAISPTYVARRGVSGWTTEGVTPPIGNVEVEGTERPRVQGLSLDLSTAYVTAAPPLTPDAERLNGSWGLYMRRSGQAERYSLLSSPSPTLDPPLGEDTATPADRFEFAGVTPDSRHVVFGASRRLLQEDQLVSASTRTAVYHWADGSLRLASVLPTDIDVEFAPNARVVPGAQQGRSLLPGDHLISDDGGRLYFTTDVERSDGQVVRLQLFVRENGTNTRLVSGAEIPGQDPLVTSNDTQFWGAKRSDGSVAFFTASRPLTVGARAASLYRWDAHGGDGARLTEISKDLSLNPTDLPGVMGVPAVSDDARTVYFVATGVLAPGGPRGTPTRHQPNLYMWRQGEGVRYIETLEDTSGDDDIWESVLTRAARVSADGERLLFASWADLDDSYETVEATPEACGDPAEGGDRCRQIYLYDARTDQLSCLTCVPGVPVTGDANLFGNTDSRQGTTVDTPFGTPRNLSADGRRVFFETARRLVSADQNSVLDVYEWEDRDLDGDGTLRLISPGRGTTDSKFLDASVTGDNVFFTTREQLVGIDRDGLIDLYVARVGGGIPAQNPPPQSQCQGEECQGSLSAAPFLPPVSSGETSHGNLRPGRRPSFSVARLSREQIARLARGQRVMVRVRVSRAGRVSLRARAKLGGKTRVVDRAAKVARRAGTVRLAVKLSRSAVRALARSGKLNVRMAVRFAGVREARTSTLRLRRSRSSAGRGTQ
jgi:NHL repeat